MLRSLSLLTLLFSVSLLSPAPALAWDPPAPAANAPSGETFSHALAPRLAAPAPSDASGGGGRFGLRAGIGTDISGGIAYGFGANYLLNLENSALELGVRVFMGEFEETTEEFHTYEETTNIFVFGLMADYLIGYRPGAGVFFISGVGVGLIEVEWEERSDGDSSLGTPLPGGGSMQSEDASDGGLILNVGVGVSLSSSFDIRGEIPVFVMFSAPGEASTVIPTFTLTAGLRF